ncbi:ATP-binding protein [Streptomyces sp. NPDC127033]|uniref:ATP-binding protein n=1 Tax=Streptomyces sp. NPDC127033 TaxID=3347110 RepID=UPI003649C052
MVNVAGIERELRIDLVVRPDGLGRIRRELVETLVTWGCEAVSDVAALVVTELLTNVHKHAGGRCGLLVTPTEAHLSVTVSDFTTAVPAKRARSSTAEDGRGLILIEELTEHWETVLTASGKDIRCAIPLPVAEKPGSVSGTGAGAAFRSGSGPRSESARS